MVKLITAGEAERVRASIQAAERMTAGEIRVSILPRSMSPNRWFGAPPALVAAATFHFWTLRENWGLASSLDVMASVAIGLGVGLVVAWLVPRLRPGRAVRRRAEREFIRLGIAKTAGRTGVLLFLSEAERRAVLLADRAIHEKVKEGTWDGVVAALVSAIKEGRTADGLIQAVGEIARVLAEHFPRRPDDVNELPDQVEMG